MILERMCAMDNYTKLLMSKLASGAIPIKPGQVLDIQCEHDLWCAVNNNPPGECNCNVEVSVIIRPGPVSILSKGQNESVINSTNAGSRNN
jgi:hypothetical protein